jgi:hypothetical protein
MLHALGSEVRAHVDRFRDVTLAGGQPRRESTNRSTSENSYFHPYNRRMDSRGCVWTEVLFSGPVRTPSNAEFEHPDLRGDEPGAARRDGKAPAQVAFFGVAGARLRAEDARPYELMRSDRARIRTIGTCRRIQIGSLEAFVEELRLGAVGASGSPRAAPLGPAAFRSNRPRGGLADRTESRSIGRS